MNRSESKIRNRRAPDAPCHKSCDVKLWDVSKTKSRICQHGHRAKCGGGDGAAGDWGTLVRRHGLAQAILFAPSWRVVGSSAPEGGQGMFSFVFQNCKGSRVV
jgi:hypothetical protein